MLDMCATGVPCVNHKGASGITRPRRTGGLLAIALKRTGALGAGPVKLLVYGAAGAGKTCLTPTLPRPVVLSSEGGLLSIAGADVPFIEVTDLAGLREAWQWLSTDTDYESVVIDSISEVAEVVLNGEKKEKKDPRQAYGAMQEQMADLVRSFRDLPKHVVMLAKLDKQADETGRLLYSPSMPGKVFAQQLPYFFDEVLALRVGADGARTLLTDGDGQWQAKDRSGRLDTIEPADLGAIIAKIGARS